MNRRVNIVLDIINRDHACCLNEVFGTYSATSVNSTKYVLINHWNVVYDSVGK